MQHIITVRGKGESGTLSFEALIAAEDTDAARELLDGIALDPFQVALFQLSGGTSGVPKIIPRFSNEYRYAIQSVADFVGLDKDVVTFTPNPLMHNAPMACFWGPTLMLGGELAIAGGPSLADIEAALTARRPRWIAMAKVHLLRLQERGILERMRFDNVIGFAVPDSAKSLSRMLRAPCFPLYGMTEGLLAHCRPGDPAEAIEHTVGRATSPYDQIRIVHPETGEDVPSGEIGELLVKGPSTIRGYYDAPDRDAEAITADGYYRSGDLMSFRSINDIDYLVFNGRVKDVVDRGGEKINCGEVEVAVASYELVGAASCVAMPDPHYGEKLCAFIVLREGAQEFSLDQLGQYLERHGLAKFKWPERLEFVQELPMTTSGKVSKPFMREIIAKKLREEAALAN